MDIRQKTMAFHNAMQGSQVRGQRVAAVEVTVDTLSMADGNRYKEPRYFVRVIFEENLVEGTKEKKLLQRLFSDVPDSAWCRCETWDELHLVLAGLKQPEWILDDETPPGLATREVGGE